YAITKRAGELIARRYGLMFGLPVVTVRLASVYGPMDRPSPARRIVLLPNRLAHLALAGEEARVNTLEAVGDYIHAGCVAQAIALLLRAPALDHDLFNIASGASATVGDVLGHVARAVPGFRWRLTAGSEANVVADPTRTRGAWGAYDVSRLAAHGWRPRPLGAALADYIGWIKDHEGPAAAPDPDAPGSGE
ncbi:MAG: NAD-dependent epimerase/dehydratase family protein, partial [Alphaproteobacteria bacterium]